MLRSLSSTEDGEYLLEQGGSFSRNGSNHFCVDFEHSSWRPGEPPEAASRSVIHARARLSSTALRTLLCARRFVLIISKSRKFQAETHLIAGCRVAPLSLSRRLCLHLCDSEECGVQQNAADLSRREWTSW